MATAEKIAKAISFFENHLKFDGLRYGESDAIATALEVLRAAEKSKEKKSKRYGSSKVSQLASIANCRVIIMDNGNGKELFTGSGSEAARSPYGECYFEAVSTRGGTMILWLHHNEVKKNNRTEGSNGETEDNW